MLTGGLGRRLRALEAAHGALAARMEEMEGALGGERKGAGNQRECVTKCVGSRVSF